MRNCRELPLMTVLAPTKSDTQPILPGATLGVLGSGQLGRMFTLAAAVAGRKMGHLTVLAETPQQAADRALAVRGRLTGQAQPGAVTTLLS